MHHQHHKSVLQVQRLSQCCRHRSLVSVVGTEDAHASEIIRNQKIAMAQWGVLQFALSLGHSLSLIATELKKGEKKAKR
jgi:hypothetical protein